MKKLLVFTGWYPTPDNPLQYPFVAQQVKIMRQYLYELDGQNWQILVWHETSPLDIPNRYLRNKSSKNFDWKDEGIPILHRQGLILSHRFGIDQSYLLLPHLRKTFNKALELLGGMPDCTWTITLSSAILWNFLQKHSKLNIPSFLQEHSNPLSMHLKTKYKRRAARELPLTISKVAVVAERQIPEFKDLSRLFNCALIWNPVDPQFVKLSPILVQSKTLIYVGRLSAEKGLDRLVRALSIVVKEDPEIFLQIIGYGDLQPKLYQQIEALGILPYVSFLGPKSSAEVASHLEKAALFVLPSYYENCPVSLLEAQVKGVPSLVTINGASEKVLLPGNGLAISDNSSGEQLARGIMDCLSNLDHYKRSEIHKRAIAEFAPGVFAKKMHQLLEEVTA